MMLEDGVTRSRSKMRSIKLFQVAEANGVTGVTEWCLVSRLVLLAVAELTNDPRTCWDARPDIGSSGVLGNDWKFKKGV